MFINSHIASGYLVGILAKQDRKWTILLIFSTVLPDIDGLWSNTVAGHHSILHTPLFWIIFCGLSWTFGKIQSNNFIQKVSAILFFGTIWGIWGVFFAIPLAVLMNTLINIWPRTEHKA